MVQLPPKCGFDTFTLEICRRALTTCVAFGSTGHQGHSNAEFLTCYGPEFIAINVREWLGRIGVKTLYIEPGSPWENGYCESLNSKLRDELLNGEIFTTLREAQVLIESWRRHYNAVRPHSSLGYRPPAPEAILPPAPGLPYAPLRPAQTLAHYGRVLT